MFIYVKGPGGPSTKYFLIVIVVIVVIVGLVVIVRIVYIILYNHIL